MTPEEVEVNRTVREQIAKELPDLIERHHKRMEEKKKDGDDDPESLTRSQRSPD